MMKQQQLGLFARLARFGEEYDAVRVPPGLYGRPIGGPIGFKIVAAMYRVLVPEQKRPPMSSSR